jgi:hypothetical protein
LKLTLRHVYDNGEIRRVSVDFSKARFDQLRKDEQLNVRKFIQEGIAGLD